MNEVWCCRSCLERFKRAGCGQEKSNVLLGDAVGRCRAGHTDAVL